MRFEFATPTRIIFGPGTLQEAGPLARAFGTRALVVTGRTLDRAARLLDGLRQNGVWTARFSVCGEPDLATVEQATTLARSEGCDLVIGLGGGSALDTAKATAALLTNGGDLLDYLEVIGRGRALSLPPAPFLAIPTTAGTGTEVTRNAVLASPQHRVKVSLRSPLLAARVALVDPELTYDCPPAVTAASGMDALTQLIEPFVSCRANPMTDAWCAEGLRRGAGALRTAFADARHPAARADMALASLFSGLALAHAGAGAAHGLAGPIGGSFPAPHGAVCAALLPHVMAVNLRALRQRQPDHPALGRYGQLARWLTGQPDAQAEDGVAWVRRLVSDLRIQPLSAYGVTAADIPALVQQASRASSTKANPIVLTTDELAEIVTAARAGPGAA